jgi:hypothetical protein
LTAGWPNFKNSARHIVGHAYYLASLHIVPLNSKKIMALLKNVLDSSIVSIDAFKIHYLPLTIDKTLRKL